MEHSTIGPLGTVIAQALQASGVDVASLFAEVGLDVASLRDPNIRIPSETMLRLIRKADAVSNDPVFGLSLAQYVHPTTFYSLGIAMYSSDTLRDFLARYVKYYRLITTNDSLQAEESEGLYRMTATPISELDTVPTRVDGFAAITTKIIRNATDENFAPKHVALARPHPEGLAQHYLDYFLCPVEFDAALTILTLSSEQLDQALPTANPELTRMYEQITEEYLAKIDKADFPRRVQGELIRLLPTGVSGKEQVAEALYMSTRTLYNKLESAGTTFRQVLDETRCDLAQGYIRQDLPIYEIAYLTGFSDTANFSRAFKKWTGKSPMEYRDASST